MLPNRPRLDGIARESDASGVSRSSPPAGRTPRLRVADPIPSSSPARTQRASRAVVLIVDDDPTMLRSLERPLIELGFDVATARNGQQAVDRVIERGFDVIVSDIGMPGLDGIQLLREIREYDLHVPVVLVTGAPAVSTAVQALEYGAFHYLTKPVSVPELERILDKATRLHRMARVKQQAAELLGNGGVQAVDRAGLEASFDRLLQTLWIAYQPIVEFPQQRVFGYEALLRSAEPSLPHPPAVLDAAERLDCLDILGRTIRSKAAAPFLANPDAGTLFVNLHVTDLTDPMLTDPDAPLSRVARQVVLEITERSSLQEVSDVRGRLVRLREMGYRIAVDDLGAGYAGLASFTLLEPEIVKLDMSLVRDVHLSSTKQKVIRSMTSLSQDMGMLVVAEGVEIAEERDTLIDLGCNLLQGFFFAKPDRAFPSVRW
jgi:EAL domain-containing protein (putative c-di-GMP-specific phosphodiesterase class I)